MKLWINDHRCSRIQSEFSGCRAGFWKMFPEVRTIHQWETTSNSSMFNQVAKGEMLMDLPTSNFYIWLVVLSILKNDGVRQWEGLSMIIPYMKWKINMFQTTNQISYYIPMIFPVIFCAQTILSHGRIKPMEKLSTIPHNTRHQHPKHINKIIQNRLLGGRHTKCICVNMSIFHMMSCCIMLI